MSVRSVLVDLVVAMFSNVITTNVQLVVVLRLVTILPDSAAIHVDEAEVLVMDHRITGRPCPMDLTVNNQLLLSPRQCQE
jgi:hypothetical protein